MNIGALRHRITFLSKSVSRDSMGGEVPTWVVEETVWAAVKPLRTRELLAAKAAQVEATIQFNVRYLATVVPEWRVRWDGKLYSIVSVIDVGGRKNEMELICVGAEP